MARKTYDELEAENRNLRLENEWIYQLISNESLSPAQKIILIATRKDISQRPQAKKEDGFTPVFQPRIEAMTGLKRKTIGTAHRDLAKAKVIDRKEIIETPGDMTSKRVYIRIRDELKKKPTEIRLDKERNHGGARTPICKHCGSGYVDVITETTLYCRNQACDFKGVGEPLIPTKREHFTEETELANTDDETYELQYEHAHE